MKTLKFIAIPLVALLALAGCGNSDNDKKTSDKLQIVASTNVWGDVATAVGGDLVEVVSIIDSPNMDPHGYEGSARDQLAIGKADLVIANGGGYDDFIEKMASSANKKTLKATSVVTTIDPQKNEHIWYSISAVGEVTVALAKMLSELDPKNSEKYNTNANTYLDGLTGVAAAYSEVRKSTEGRSYFGTEPLADWLMADLKLVNKTPEEFAEAVENETDIPPATMKESLDLIKAGKIDVLVVNLQTETTQTQKIVDAAKAAGVKMVSLTEILPTGIGYVEWMGANSFSFTN